MGDLEGNVVNNSWYMQNTNKRNKRTWSYAYDTGVSNKD